MMTDIHDSAATAGGPELISIKAATSPPHPFGKFSVPTLYKLIREGRVRAYKVGSRTMIDVVSLREGLRAEPLVLPVKAAPSPPKNKAVTAAEPARHRKPRSPRKARTKGPARRSRAAESRAAP